MRIHSPWTLAAVQVLGLLGPRAASCAPSVAMAVERHHERGHGQDGQRNMMVPPVAAAAAVEAEAEGEKRKKKNDDDKDRSDSPQPLPLQQLLEESLASSGLGIDSLFSSAPYTIAIPPLFADSIITPQSPSSSGPGVGGGREEEQEQEREQEEELDGTGNENENENKKDKDQTRDQEPYDPTTSVPTRYYSTVLGRRLLALSSHGVLTSIFPSNLSSSSSTPPSVGDTPIGLPEYIASCEEPSGNPTILSLKVSTATRNAAGGSNVSLALSWWDEYIHLTGQRPWALANLPRLSLTGYLEEIPPDQVSERAIETCFLQKHRDSIMWLPGRKWAAHQGFWTRLVVTQAYWIGGFGDKNYIGWFDPDEWRTVRKEDWEAVRLPGEKE